MSSSHSNISPSAKRAVSFAPTARQQRIRHIHDYSAEEIRDCWYQKADFDRIQASIRYSLTMMEGCHLYEQDEDLCLRGTESLSAQGANRRMYNRKASRCAVLEEQERQKKQGINDPELIAQTYADASRPCRTAAYAIGQADAQAIARELPPVVEKRLKSSFRICKIKSPCRKLGLGRPIPRRFSNAAA